MPGYKIKPWEELTITDDYMFKLVMRHKRFCKRLIEKILNIKIKDIKYLEEEKTFKFKYSGKGIRLDVYIEGDDVIYDVEMQVHNYGDRELARRTRYYQSMIDVDALARGDRYQELRNSYIIFLCPFSVFDGQRHMYSFNTFCRQDKSIELKDGATKVFLSSEAVLDDVSPDVQAFLDYMKGLPSADSFVTEVDQFIQQIKIDNEERVSYMTYEMKLREAEDYGRAEGRTEGRAEALAFMALEMLRDNQPIEKIVQYSHLSESRILELAQQIR